MKNKSIFILMIMVISLALVFVACDKPEETPEPTEKATATATPNITEEPTEEPTAEPTAEPTPEPTQTPDSIIYSNDNFSDSNKTKNDWELGNYKVENGVLKSDFSAPCLQGKKSLKTFTFMTDMKMIEHKEDATNYIGMWIGENLGDKKVTIGYYPKENKIKTTHNNTVLKEVEIDPIAVNEVFSYAIRLSANGQLQIYINKVLVFEHTNALYKHDNVIVFWNESNVIELDNLILADEKYTIE